jgi:catechol 2,3-dioxygenase-like lactoylglutathione lyase family enzyme
MLRPIHAAADDPYRPAKSLLPIAFSSLNSVRVAVDNGANTLRWYQKVFGMPVVYRQNKVTPVLKIGNGPHHISIFEGKLAAAVAPGSPTPYQKAFIVPPHVSFGVKGFNVDRLMRALAEVGVHTGRTHAREQAAEMFFEDPNGFPLQLTDVTGCGGSGFLATECDMNAVAPRDRSDPPPVQVDTLNHVKFIVPDVSESIAWYQRLSGMQIMTYQEMMNGRRTAGYNGPPVAVLRVGSGPQHLTLIEGSSPERNRPRIGLGITGFNLEGTKKQLDAHGVRWTVRMREGVTSELLVEAPDNVALQLVDAGYCGGGGELGNVCDPRRRPIPTSRRSAGND